MHSVLCGNGALWILQLRLCVSVTIVLWATLVRTVVLIGGAQTMFPCIRNRPLLLFLSSTLLILSVTFLRQLRCVVLTSISRSPRQPLLVPVTVGKAPLVGCRYEST